MKEVRFFYVPEATASNELPEEEAQHAVKVLRMDVGDDMILMDGKGNFYRAIVSGTAKKHCYYTIDECLPQKRQWNAHLHLAMAPTKNMDRTEWFAEKATEIGFDELSFLKCRFSERTQIKNERVDRILVSAMKQSHKAWKPILNEMTNFSEFVKQQSSNSDLHKYICHCYDEPDLGTKVSFKDVMKSGENSLVLIGPEGDFSIDEVRMAESMGFQSVTLGESRLRTETAALVAVHIMNLANQ